MFSELTRFAGQLIDSVLGVAGIRWGTEEPAHSSRRLSRDVELRSYDARLAAETTVADAEEPARSEGFRRLAGYIFGKNHGGPGGSESIAMTAPVAQQSGQRIAMTAPVAQTADAADVGSGWVIRFFLPAQWTLQSLPDPDDRRVRLTEVPAEVVAVLRFTGDRGPDAVRRRTDELRQVLAARGIAATGEPAAWFYDPPWTLPFRRRNEIAIPVAA